MRTVLISVCLAGICAAVPSTARATTITFDGKDLAASYGGPFPNSDTAHAGFQAAVSGSGQLLSTIDFESAALGSFASISLGGGVTAAFSGDFNPGVSGISNNNASAFGTFDTTRPGSRYTLLQTSVGGSGAALTFNFANAIDTFGVYITGLGTDATMTLAFNDGTSQTVPITGGTPGGFTDAQFVGFTDFGASIGSVSLRLNNANYYIGVDDLSFSTAVPEPASLLLLGSGLLGVAARRRRRHLRDR